jgi:hypothetical protein
VGKERWHDEKYSTFEHDLDIRESLTVYAADRQVRDAECKEKRIQKSVVPSKRSCLMKSLELLVLDFNVEKKVLILHMALSVQGDTMSVQPASREGYQDESASVLSNPHLLSAV